MRKLAAFLCAICFIITCSISALAAQPKDTTAPVLSSATPASGQLDVGIDTAITIKFSESVLKGKNFTKITLTDINNKTVSITLTVKDNIVSTTPNSRLAFSTEYKLTIPAGAVKDKAGNSLAKQEITKFRTVSSKDSLKKELSSVVNGVKKISVVNPGPLEIKSSDWLSVVSGDSLTSNTVFVSARKYGYGRILALGKEELLTNDVIYTLDNLLLIKNSMKWLNGSGKKRVGFSMGHGEFVNNQTISGLKKELEKEKFTLRQTKLTDNELKNLDILIIGNAWTSFTPAEINSVKTFVTNGGGLVLAGLGWSFEAYNPGKPYPMDTLSSDFGVKWGVQVIADTTETYQGQPVFSVFYPNSISLDTALNDAIHSIEQITAAHAQDLLQALETDSTLKSEYVKAQLFIAKRVIESDRNDIIRQKIYDLCKRLVQQYPQYFSKKPTFDLSKYPTMAWLRERLMNTWISSLELTDARKNEIGTIGGFEGKYLDIWTKTGIYIADNNGLDDLQKKILLDTLLTIPAKLHNVRVIAVENLIQTNLVNIPYAGFALFGNTSASQKLNPGMDLTTTVMQGLNSSICITNAKVSDYSENSFPAAVAPGNISVYSGVFYHEINHIVDFYTVYGSVTLKARRDELLRAAGDNASNYLRSMFENGFFTKNPYEFFASISNEWFTDSAKTVELGLKSFDTTSKHPINQALFMAEVYSAGGNTTCFYLSNSTGNISYSQVPVGRDGKGRINALTFNGYKYSFELDANGNVTSYTSTKQ